MVPDSLKDQVQVSVPFSLLVKYYLPTFLQRRLNPEISIDADSLEQCSQADFAQVARQFQEAGLIITLHAPFQDLWPGALDGLIRSASRTRLKEALALLEIFQPSSIVCHLAYDDNYYHHCQDLWLDHSLATWGEMAALAAEYNTRLMLENVREPHPHLLLSLFSRLTASNVGFCLDVGHLQAFAGGRFQEWLEVLWPYVEELHLHDNHGQADEHLALGAGIVPFALVLNFLAAKGRRPLITLEPHQEESLEPSLAYLADIWPW
ncbi:MAG: sugar phosphate isomerase/epimerase [Deltaproteobacteria bacterium]|nr:sugar phosphate isomerase/epimerase [Deltaproteobacteria bacterium]